MELVVARIGRAQGLSGEVNVEVRTDDPASRFVVGAQFRTDPGSAGPLRLRGVRRQGARTVLAFDGVHDRTGAEALRGVALLVDVGSDADSGADSEADAGAASSGAPDAASEWYDFQLIGLRVEHVDGRLLGQVAAVQHLPAQDLLEVRPASDSASDPVLVPFVTALVPVVDIAAGRVVVDPPGGLFEPLPGED